MMQRVFLFLILICNFKIAASISDYITPWYGNQVNVYGSLGLIQIPSARFQDEGTASFTFSDSGPYKRGVITAYPFEWFEASYRYVDIDHTLYSDSIAFSGTQTLKDKGFNLKMRILTESKFRPQIAFGLRDLAGTGRFSSEYVVASKKFNNLDLSIGIATGFLGSSSNIRNPLTYISNEFSIRSRKSSRSSAGGELAYESWFSGPASIFWGASYIVPYARGAVLKLEYDPNNYLQEGGKPLPKDFDYNFGVDFPLIKDTLKLGINFERGNTISLNASIAINLSKNLISKKRPKPKIEERFNYSRNRNVKSEAIYTNTLKHLLDNGILLQGMNVDKESNLSTLFISQGSYLSRPQLTTAVFEVVDQTHPKIIEKFEIIEVTGGFNNYKVFLQREGFRSSVDLYDYSLLEDSLHVSRANDFNFQDSNPEFQPKISWPLFHYNISPALRNHIGGPDAFYFGQAWLRIDSEIGFNRSSYFKSILGISLVDNFANLKLPSDSILPHVRTDIVKYLKQGKNNILRAQYNYINKINHDIFYKFSAGIFEEMFGGFGGEILYRPFAKNHAIGIEAYQVRQRNYEQDLGFQDYQTITGHLSFYYKEPRSRILFKFSGGRYLAKDSGITLEASRYFDNGLEIGAFFSQTDVSKEEFGEGSFDKGFFFNIPLQVFLSTHSKHRTYFGLRPLTRDGAAKLIVGSALWDVTYAHDHQIFNDKSGFYD